MGVVYSVYIVSVQYNMEHRHYNTIANIVCMKQSEVRNVNALLKSQVWGLLSLAQL